MKLALQCLSYIHSMDHVIPCGENRGGGSFNQSKSSMKKPGGGGFEKPKTGGGVEKPKPGGVPPIKERGG